MTHTAPATYHRSDLARLARCEPADPVSYDISPAAIALANTLDALVSFLSLLSDPEQCAYPEFAFDAACEMHADAVAMLPGGPWVAPMPFDCVEPVVTW